MVCTASLALAQDYADKKILFIDSYHMGFPASREMRIGIKKVLKKTQVELHVFEMDTKRNPEEAFIRKAALKAKQFVARLQPDVVIVGDDNAAKFLLKPYYKDADLPFVFCGINWDASIYGLPYKNTTGMIEVALVSEIYRHLKKYAQGERVGFLGGDRFSEHKNRRYYQQRFDIPFAKTYFAKTFSQWKTYFLKLQNEVDMALLTTHMGIPDWNDEQARAFVEKNVAIPIGTEHEWEMPFALIGVTKDFEEMGIWAAQTALSILDGTPPSHIPISANKKGHLYFNLRLAKKLGIKKTPPLAILVK
jgi:ABC-type uncharacterized transport system substrate-binding protein